MTVEGIDYASGTPNLATLKADGIRFVCRYLSTPGNPKNLTLSEAKRLREAGLSIVVVFETTGNRSLSGRSGGQADGRSARQQLIGCGLPVTLPVYFAVDFDATPAQQATINAYLAGAADALGGPAHVGVYGGYYVVKRALDAGVCWYGWQTYAWSGGQWDRRAQLQQYRNGVQLAGVTCDRDRATVEDYGQWPRPSPAKPPGKKPGGEPLPGPARKPPWFWKALKEYLRRRNKKP